MRLSDEKILKVNEIFRSAHLEGRKTLFEHEVYGILNILGLDIPKHVFVSRSVCIDDKLLQPFGQKLVVKIVSSEIAHKQKLGGVRIIDKPEALFVRFVIAQMEEEVLSHFTEQNKPNINGYLLVEFIPHTKSLGYELLVGTEDDIAFGPVVTLSKGGDDAEFFARSYDPANHFLAPLDYTQAIEMIDSIKIKEKYFETGHLLNTWNI